ncbi:MAG: bacillithiol biosynthesis cysteine-adding enzyme BshC [Saprospiraceae bacterium]|nr:bacillithiol biosynthesis cysteine-adding enzyme BshC [Saprospiraceae bacterium]
MQTSQTVAEDKKDIQLPFHFQKIPCVRIPGLSHRDLSYIQLDPALATFYKYKPEVAAFAQVIEDKAKDKTNRELLVKVLKEQYQKVESKALSQQQIDALLEPNTFTVTTAHQPSLFTGPLYYIYKIASTINLARLLKATYPDYNFVPVFVSGGEDHDFEEVNHINLFGKSLSWESGESGSVGNMKTDSLQPVLESLKEILGSSNFADEAFQMIYESHTKHAIYSDAVFDMVNRLFGHHGLVFLNMNHPDLKRAFIPIMKDELLHQSSAGIIEKTIERLEQKGFSAQANPREINLFYLQDQHRDRIVKEGDVYKVLDSDLSFTSAEMLAELENHPERFSPNVVLRPLYQETILPNLAYIGGGGEIAYWLERKEQFEHYDLNFPMLIRRKSVLWIDKSTEKKMEKLELNLMDLMDDTDKIIRKYVKEVTDNELTVQAEKEQIEKAFDGIAAKAKEVDPGLERAILAEKTRQLKTIEQLESRILRTEKQKHDTAVNQIRAIKDKLFPNNGLQERYDNFLFIYLKHGAAALDYLVENLDPMDNRFVVVTE